MTGATPLPSQTPLHGSAMTPMATPLHRSMGTPQAARSSDAWNVANDDALLETQLNEEKDITHATSFGAPLEPVGSGNDGLSNRSFGSSFNSISSKSSNAESSGLSSEGSLPNTGLHPTTPGLQPRTPAFMMGTNPMTPGMNPTTPGLNPTTPAALSAATPGHLLEPARLEPRTPGFGVATPDIGLHTTTPGLATPGYHHNPTTPGLYGTPMNGLGSMESAATPGITSGLMHSGMSGIPATPAYNHNPIDTLHSGTSEVTWKMKGVQVTVTAGPNRGSVGVISSVNADALTVDINGQLVVINTDNLQPVTPEKQDAVIILSGEEAGQTGSLIGTDGSDGIVKVDGDADIKIYPLNSLAKIVN